MVLGYDVSLVLIMRVVEVPPRGDILLLLVIGTIIRWGASTPEKSGNHQDNPKAMIHHCWGVKGWMKLVIAAKASQGSQGTQRMTKFNILLCSFLNSQFNAFPSFNNWISIIRVLGGKCSSKLAWSSRVGANPGKFAHIWWELQRSNQNFKNLFKMQVKWKPLET